MSLGSVMVPCMSTITIRKSPLGSLNGSAMGESTPVTMTWPPSRSTQSAISRSSENVVCAIRGSTEKHTAAIAQTRSFGLVIMNKPPYRGGASGRPQHHNSLCGDYIMTVYCRYAQSYLLSLIW